MGSELGLILVVVLLLAGGAGVGLAIGLRPTTWTGWAGFLGVAYLLGFSVFAIVAQLSVVVGLPPWPALLVLAALASFIPFRLPGKPVVPKLGRADGIALGLYALLVLLLLVVGAWVVIKNPVTAWDSWSIWARKAIMLGDSLGPLTTPPYEFTHPDYPIGVPALESAFFFTAGSNDTVVGDLPAWLLVPAALAGLAALAPARPRFYVPVLAALAVLPPLAAQTLVGYADVPLALLLAAATLSGGRWLNDREGRHLWVAAILIGGAICVKNEGVIVGMLLAVLLTALGWKERKRLVPVWVVALAAFLPWRLWLAFNHVEGDLPIGKVLDPVFMFDRIDRPVEAFGRLMSESLFHLGSAEKVLWGVVLISALTLVVLNLPRRSALLGVLAAVGALAALLFAYWVSPHDLAWHLLNSADRVILLPVAILVSSALLFVDPESDSDEPDPRATAPL